jgi:DNA repair photolyase
VDVEYLEQPCKSALNRVKGMPFNWSLNPYMGCEHRCAFCYVRAFEKRADRASDDRYGRSVRVKTNVADVLRRELARASWKQESVAVGAATDPYQPAEVAYFVPQVANAPTGACQINDVFVDDRGIVFAVDRHVGGLYALEMDF